MKKTKIECPRCETPTEIGDDCPHCNYQREFFSHPKKMREANESMGEPSKNLARLLSDDKGFVVR
ncbi:MAG: hypothetical protein ABFQ65_03795 [Nanoarchaeota archaeon]